MLNKVCFVCQNKVYENGKMTEWICVQSAGQEPILILRQEMHLQTLLSITTLR